MKIIYDDKTDNIYIKFTDDAVVESEEKSDGVIVDYNQEGDIVAVEVLNIKTNPHEVDIPTVLKSAS